MHVEAAFATNRLSSSVTVHSTYPIVRPRCTDLSFRLEPCLPDRAKEINFQFDRSERFLRREGARNAMPIAASAISQRIPPCSVPMGFACCGPAAKTTVARPSAMSFASNPIRRATGNVVRFCPFPKVRLTRGFLDYYDLSALAFDFRAANFGFEVFLQMTAGKIEGLFLPLQTTHHMGCLRACWQSR